MHDTSDIRSCWIPDGVGLAMIDHAVPFHRSTSVRSGIVDVALCPTAKHVVVDTHEISSTLTSTGAAGLGIGTSVHVEPFQRAP